MAAYAYPTPCDMPYEKYRPFRPLALPDRTWADRQLTARRSGAASTSATATRPSSIRWTRTES